MQSNLNEVGLRWRRANGLGLRMHGKKRSLTITGWILLQHCAHTGGCVQPHYWVYCNQHFANSQSPTHNHCSDGRKKTRVRWGAEKHTEMLSWIKRLGVWVNGWGICLRRCSVNLLWIVLNQRAGIHWLYFWSRGETQANGRTRINPLCLAKRSPRQYYITSLH